MVSWLSDKFKFDFDLQGAFGHTLTYFGMFAAAVYIIRIALWLIGRVHGDIKSDKEEAAGGAKKKAASGVPTVVEEDEEPQQEAPQAEGAKKDN